MLPVKMTMRINQKNDDANNDLKGANEYAKFDDVD